MNTLPVWKITKEGADWVLWRPQSDRSKRFASSTWAGKLLRHCYNHRCGEPYPMWIDDEAAKIIWKYGQS